MEDLLRIVRAGELSTDDAELYRCLTAETGKFIEQEGNCWDFKQVWPFSYSDEYFGGIARLICAFANSNGGLVVFGVHDSARTGGHNKVRPNIDRLLQSLKQLLSELPVISWRGYREGTEQAIDVLLVQPIGSSTMPIRFSRTAGTYEKDVIWVRQGHEVVAAEPRHVPMLYCRSNNQTDDGNDKPPSFGLPPSPSTIKRFVGRVRTIDEIFRWLKLSDEPRTFLYGKGGSGKTTIAYEVAKSLHASGAQFEVAGGEKLDNVIFVSAKQRALDTMTQSTIAFVGKDFSNVRELYESILTLGNWTTSSLADLSLEQIQGEIKSFFDLTSNLIVVDDIDTLTTNGLEAGFDFLYGTLWRSKRRSKLLYTLRNAPTQSLANAIEVPGLEGDEYSEFVNVCRKQFRVEADPGAEFINGRLAVISERRPLVVESIVALVRTAGSFARAADLFEEGAGDDVRRYVFQREWNALSPTHNGRYVLAVLALYEDPLSFEDIVALTRYEERRVSDSLAEVREMFLTVNEISKEASYQLGPMTRAFVLDEARSLDQFPAIKERVVKYKTAFFPDNPILSRLRDNVEALVQRSWRFGDEDALKRAVSSVSNSSLSPKITEDPRFNSLRGYVCASHKPPKLDDAREFFRRAIIMKYEPEFEYLKAWFYAELNSGHGREEALKIADLICQGKRYPDEIKQDFLSRKASILFNRGRDNVNFDPSKGVSDLQSSLLFQLQAYASAFELSSPRLDKIEEYSRNTAYVLFQFFAQNRRYEDLLEYIARLPTMAIPRFDPIEEPIANAIEALLSSRGSKGELQKFSNKVAEIIKSLGDERKWYDHIAQRRLLKSLATTRELLVKLAQNAARR